MREPALKTKIGLRNNALKKISLRSALTGFGALLLCACTTVPLDPAPQPRPGPGPVITTPDEPVTPAPTDPTEDMEQPEDRIDPIDIPDEAAPFFNNRDGITLPHMAGRDTKRVALLLPFSASSERLREEANSMFEAAKLALFQRPTADLVMTVLDTQGTEAGAQSATRAALQQGADVILGPVIARNVLAASREAAPSGTPVIAFSNDQSVADRGRYLLSFPPEAEVERIVRFAASEGIANFAFFGPDDGYGRRVLRAYEDAIARVGGELTASETYRGNDISVMQEPAQRLADYHRSVRSQPGVQRDAFEAILMPEAGIALRSLAPLLPFYGVDPARVLFMGTSRWDDRDTAREPALGGGVFAAADKEARDMFLADYDRAFGEAPSGLASLAYDAIMLGAVVADGDPRSRIDRIESPLGFYGTDGFIQFGSDGRPYRGLAVYRIEDGQFRVIEPAPRGPAPEG